MAVAVALVVDGEGGGGGRGGRAAAAQDALKGCAGASANMRLVAANIHCHLCPLVHIRSINGGTNATVPVACHCTGSDIVLTKTQANKACRLRQIE
jgi:hypothetical protein